MLQKIWYMMIMKMDIAKESEISSEVKDSLNWSKVISTSKEYKKPYNIIIENDPLAQPHNQPSSA